MANARLTEWDFLHAICRMKRERPFIEQHLDDALVGYFFEQTQRGRLDTRLLDAAVQAFNAEFGVAGSPPTIDRIEPLLRRLRLSRGLESPIASEAA